MRTLFSKRPAPYYIYAYDYRRTSAGVRVLHLLCDALVRSGYEAYVVANQVSPGLMTPRLTNEVAALHRSLGVRPIAVYPEVLDGNPLGAETVVRYLLNQPGHLKGSGIYAQSDILFAYSEALLQPGMSRENRLFLIPIALDIFKLPDDPAIRVPGKVCYYQGRAGQAPLDPALLPPGSIEITQHYPDSWEALADIFQRCELFYCGEASSLCGEAALCGCLPVVVPGPWAKLAISRSETASNGCAWGNDPREIERARSTLPLVRENFERLNAGFWDQLDHFIEVTQRAAATVSSVLPTGEQSDVRLSTATLQLQRQRQFSATDHYLEHRVIQQMPDLDDSPLGVVIHVQDVELFREILVSLTQLDQSMHLYVSCHDRVILPVAALLQETGLGHSLMRVERRGQDWLPFLKFLPQLREEGIEFLLKLHSVSRPKGLTTDLTRQRIAELVFNEGVRAALNQLENGSGHLLGSQLVRTRPSVMQQVGEARNEVLRLAERAKLSIGSVLTSDYVPDGMFYARVDALHCLEALALRDDEFEEDDGRYAGSFTQAFEMFFSVFVDANNGSDVALSYERWLARRRFTETDLPRLQLRLDGLGHCASVLIIIRDEQKRVDEIRRTLASLAGQYYAAAAVVVLSDAEPVGIAGADNLLWLAREASFAVQLNALLRQIEVDWVYLLDAGDELEAHSLLLLADRLDTYSQWRVCYSDEDSLLGDVRQSPVFKPDLNLDLLRSYPYLGGTLALQRQALLELGGLDDRYGGLAVIDLVFRLIETSGFAAVGHLDEILVHKRESLGEWLVRADVAPHIAHVTRAHLQRLGVAHELRRGIIGVVNRILYRHPTQPLVSIVIPTKDQLPLLQRCVSSLRERTTYPHYEVLIVDNNSETADARAWLAELEQGGDAHVRVLRYPHPFNYSAINNSAIAQARGEYVVLLNNDTAVIQGDWIEMLLHHAQRPEVGIVGAKLLYPDGRVQHGGVVLGLRGPADHPFVGETAEAPGYMHRLQVDQNYSAVTAACLMIRKSVYDDVGGMDEERFKVSFNDVDLCLKVGAAGYLAVWTPYATLLHEGNVSQNTVDTTALSAKVIRFQGEQAYMYDSWLAKIARDPAYNKNLVLEGTGFAFSSSSITPWYPFAQRHLPFVLCHPADPYGCGHYRVLKPFQALEAAQLIEGATTEMLLTPVELERLSPDAVVFQRQIAEVQINVIRDAGRFSKTFKVYELDDYVLDLPSQSQHRAHMPKDLSERLPVAIGLCDRLVVSTQPLAEALGSMHSDIRVVENRLPLQWWGDLQSRRRVGRKPRVGWAGGAGHTGDLAILVEVVQTLAQDVEWVFLGMTLKEFQPYIHEFHSGVLIGDYPAKLASLNLDLALAPLEYHLFNECKSNLRLLEYGACGFPVICTDIGCYRGDLPVTRVANTAQAWVAAIREHLADMDETARRGDRLRTRVLRDWTLQGVHLQEWRRAWLSA
nr:glycosyltransferase [uncultured Pseudomonas sp.]